MDDEDRQLGPEMIAEGWVVVGGDWLMWMHEPSHRTVNIEGPYTRSQTRLTPSLHDAPSDPDAQGYIVACALRDDHGYPIGGDSFWTPSYAEALRRARAIRQSILDAQRRIDTSTQLSFDDVQQPEEA